MARYGVTYEKVASTAAELLASDITPTVDRVRSLLGTGSKSTIAKHLKRWRVQTELKEHAFNAFDPDQIPEELMVLVHDFWHRFYQSQLAEHRVRVSSADYAQELPLNVSKPKNVPTKSVQNMHEELALIQDYVVGLEAELAESTALQHRLAQRLSAFYANPETFGILPNLEALDPRPSKTPGVSSSAAAPPLVAPEQVVAPQDLADPKIHAMPILAELAAVQAALSRAEETHNHLEADLDWATRRAFDLASAEAELASQLQQAREQIDASAVREAALIAENQALKEQITHLRRALTQRQRFIERLEGEMMSFRPAEIFCAD
jgi:hypothetical protein